MIHFGRAQEVWPLLQHSRDPRLRSFIVNWLGTFGTDPQLLDTELERIAAIDLAQMGGSAPNDRTTNRGRRVNSTARSLQSDGVSATADPNAGPPKEGSMEAILFHPDTSVQRALILALGKYGSTELSAIQRESLIAKLLGLYENCSDAGVHSAAEWSLRQHGQHARILEINKRLKSMPTVSRRWYVNGKEQTFVIIEGPVEFPMGSESSEANRRPSETPHLRLIPRKFAISNKEVTVAQFQEYLKVGLNRHSPDAAGPINGMTWYLATGYCNWLSRQEHLPECYEPNGSQQYQSGMTIKSNGLKLGGYRLPTEAEWEYSCRAGATTSRYYGDSIRLLDAYAWTQTNAAECARTCGILLPNDLGLFDMLGNVWEWCQDQFVLIQPAMRGPTIDDPKGGLVQSDRGRVCKGASHLNQPSYARSAIRAAATPEAALDLHGFRLARTLE